MVPHAYVCIGWSKIITYRIGSLKFTTSKSCSLLALVLG